MLATTMPAPLVVGQTWSARILAMPHSIDWMVELLEASGCGRLWMSSGSNATTSGLRAS